MIRVKRIMAFLWIVSSVSVSRLQAQVTSSFNFSRDPRPVSGWINMYGDPSTASTPITQTDATTGITLSSIGSTNWAGYNGGASADGGGVSNGTFFPSAVMQNHWFQFSNYYALYNVLVPQLKISGLNVDSVYTLRMTGSFAIYIPDPFSLNPMRYTVRGAVIYGYVDVNGEYNVSDGAVFANVAPDASGNIYVYVNTYGGANVTSISGLQITRGRSAAPVPNISITHPSNNDVLPEDGNIHINATASETNGSIARVEFYINNALVASDSVLPYQYIWVNPDEGHYTIKARAVDGTGNTNSQSINVSVESLSSFWSMTGNIDANADSNFLGTVDTNRLAFRTNNLERMSILGDGSVGIGTRNTQGYKLAVNGSAIFTKLRIRAYSGWPDYVFKRDYKLPGLDSLDRYIRINQHLPGMVSASDAEKKGVDIADQQAALLKKVEELTLYLIEEHRQVEALKKEVQRLKAKARH